MNRSKLMSGGLIRWWCRALSVAACCALLADARAAEPSATVRGTMATTGLTRIQTVGNVTVFRTPDPDRRLDFVAIVPAKVGEVWSALTTVEGIQSFYAPGAVIELRPGGAYEIHHAPEAAPGERGMEGTKILSFVPEAMLSGTGSAPPEFAQVRREKTKWVILLDDADGGTRVQMSMIEWGRGAEWDRAYDYFAEHNPAFLEALRKRFAEGPVDWKERGVEIKEVPKRAESGNPKLWRVDKSLVIKTNIHAIWDLFTTEEGLKSWAAPEVEVDLRIGGAYERLDNPTAPEGRRGQEDQRVLAYLPDELLSYSWLAPPQFPEVRKGPAWETWRFSDLGDGWVRIRYTALGLGDGPQWRDAFNLLDQRMDFVMNNLRVLLNE